MGTHQRGTLRIESGCWYGYFNTYDSYDPETDKRKRRQRCVKLCPKRFKKFEAYKILAAEIDRTLGPDGSARPTYTTLETFTRRRWIPLKEGRWRSDGPNPISTK